MYLRHQPYTLYYRHVCILVFLHVFEYSMLLRCMLKFKPLACGSEDVTQYNCYDLFVVAELCQQAITSCGRISIFLEGFLNTFRLLLVVGFIKCQAFCYKVML